MCGIVGFIGERAAAPVLLSALARMEYRGYDSAGMATISDGRLHVKKDAGKLAEVREKQELDRLPGRVGLGHVRWATHGQVTAANAHPHLDCRGEIAVVHNGIIENYQELRCRLADKHRFLSDTDTEVVAHLIEEYMGPGTPLEEAVVRTTKELRGSYALAVMSIREPDKVVASRKDSPLVVGVGTGENFVASDVLAFQDETKRAIFVEDGESVVMTRGAVHLLDGNGIKIHRDPIEIDWVWGSAHKGVYDHFMLKEIMEQPQALRCAVMQDRDAIMEMAMEILRARSVVFTACGTSRYAALIGRYLFSRIPRKFSEVVMASEFRSQCGGVILGQDE